MDVPNPNDQEVLEFAAGIKLAGASDDENARAIKESMDGGPEGAWISADEANARRDGVSSSGRGRRAASSDRLAPQAIARRLSARQSLQDLGTDRRILDLVVLGEQKRLRQDEREDRIALEG